MDPFSALDRVAFTDDEIVEINLSMDDVAVLFEDWREKRFALIFPERHCTTWHLEKAMLRYMGENADDKEFKYASTEKISRYEHLLTDFLVYIIDFEPEAVPFAFISDESTLWYFVAYGQDPEAEKAQITLWQARIKEKYGVDVSDLEDAYLVDILERIAASD